MAQRTQTDALLRLTTATVLVGLAGCATQWNRPNTTEAQFYQDRFECEQLAAGSYPPSMVQRMSSPGVYAPPPRTQTTCSSVGGIVSCRSAPSGLDASIYNRPPTYVTDDANAPARAYAVGSCLMSRGYRQQKQNPLGAVR